MINNIEKLSAKIWNVVLQGAEAIAATNSSINFVKESKDTFYNKFQNLYKELVDKYMEDAEEPLDRHKVAAITIITVIKSDVLVCSKIEKGSIFFGNYTLATDVALVYMLAELNKRLVEKVKNEINYYFFPEAMACETDYYKIFYRNLYFANSNEEWGLNPLDIAERLFLIEYMTLEKNGIDPSILNEY